MTSKKRNHQQPTPQLWATLPECQQELLSGGAPRITTPPPSGTGDSPTGTCSPTISTI